MSGADYDAVVYDLDGTLVDLDVDWEATAVDVREVYAAAAVDVPAGDLWELLAAAADHDLAPEVEAAIAAREREGARRAARLPLAEELLACSVPAGICSLNCEEACRIALDSHDLLEAVDAVVGRDTVGSRKPDPEPLLEAVSRIGATPGRTLFVGDSERDARTAERAGTAFEYVDG
ncbi:MULTISPECIES: HAD family hydrolase [Saliphagus]|uniref:HAD family hydrolase n=1 Tax=Saliphagus infecundisoli TaxID=1849069 RepID=A0ABD5QFN2_9EURY|nr:MULTISPECIES: HAD-IA family hydrolase [Saliphagus]